MNSPVESRLLAGFGAFSKLCAFLAALTGLLALFGWALNIETLKSILPGLVSMKANTALGLLLAGFALWLALLPEQRRKSTAGRRLAQGAACVVILIGAVTLAEYAFGWNPGLDQLLFRESAGAFATSHPGRMAPATALNFLLLGFALLFLDYQSRRGHIPAQALALVAGALSALGLVGYAFGLDTLYGLAPYTPMALHTAAAFAVLSAGLLCARPTAGFMAVFVSDTHGGSVIRRLLPAAVVIPLILGWLRWKGESGGFYETRVGIALYATSMILILSLAVWWTARSLQRSDLERRRVQQELDNIFNLSLDLFCIAGFDGYFKRLNPAWERTLGYSREELLARPYFDFIHPEDRQATLAEADKIAAGTTTLSFENRYRARDASYRWFLWTATPDLQQGLIYAAARDITERKHLEETLRESEQRLTLASTSGEVGVWDLDLTTGQAWRSLQHDRIFGYESLLPSWSYEVFSGHVVPEDREPVKQRFEEAFQTGRLEFECRIIRADQVVRWISAKGEAFRNEQGQPIRMMGVITDVTERKQAELARAHLAAIVESSEDAIYSKALDGTLQTWNAGAERFYGYTAKEILGHSVFLLLPPDRSDELPDMLERIRRGEQVEHCETERIRKDGRRIHVSLTLSPLRDSAGRIVGASTIARDVTERKRAEQALHELNRELEAFTYSVSHDLRAPLRHIDGFSRILQEDFGATLGPEARRYLERIRHGTRQMGQLIDDLLELSRVARRDLRRQPTPLAPLVEEVRAQLQPEFNGRQVEWRLGELPVVEADRALLKLVLVNLLSNALKYSRPRSPALIEVGQAEQNGQPVVFVRDNGVGFDMKYAGKLFGVFQRLHRPEDFEGTGVGLATVERIIRKHGGRVWAEAEPDRGATFYFSLPAPGSLPAVLDTEREPLLGSEGERTASLRNQGGT